MIVAAAVALLLLPLVVLRRKTLFAYYGVDAATWLLAYLLWLRLPAFDPWLACIALAAVKLVTLSLFLANGSDVRWSANRAAILAAVVYALAIGAMRHPPNGDERYYLLLTDSMTRDGDLDLANQYGDRAFHALFEVESLGPQEGDPKGPDGELYSRHEPFLALLLAPGWLLAGTHGAMATMVLFGALLVRSTMRWIEDEGVSDAHARAVFPFFAFGPPVLFFATRIWPEVPGAFFFVEAVRGFRDGRSKKWMPMLLALVLLKLRFVLVAVGLVGQRAKKNVLTAAGIVAAPLLLLWWLTGSATNVHSWGELLPAPFERYVTGFSGILTDGMSGIPFQAPFYLFGLFAITRWKSAPRGFRTGLLAGLIYILYLLPRPEWFGGWSPPLRYLVFLMPVLALGAASQWERISRGAIALAAAWTTALVIHGITYPWRLFHIANGENPIGEWFSWHFKSDFSRLFPSFIRTNHASWIGVAVVLLLIAIGVRRMRLDLAIPLATLTIAFGFVHAQKAGARVEFEDAHVVKQGGELTPHEYFPARFRERGGWLLREGESLSFLARAGTHDLKAITGLGAVIELAGQAYQVGITTTDQTIRVSIPRDERVTLRCVSGAINLDRMDHVH